MGFQDISHQDIINDEESVMGHEQHVPTSDTVLEDEVSITDIPLDERVEDEEQPLEARHRRVSWFTRANLLDAAPFLGVMLLGALLRFWGLGDKPLHHDESLHAYISLHFMGNWIDCFNQSVVCYRYDPLTHGPFQFHAIALVYQIAQFLGAPDSGVNTFTVRIPAALLGTVIIGLPYFLRDRLGSVGALIAAVLLATSPSMVYFSRFAREDIYMACFTLLLVVATARYLRTRNVGWIVIAFGAFALSYATKEATFLTVAVFGSFLGALLLWELGVRLNIRARSQLASPARLVMPRTASPIFVLIYLILLGLFARWFFGVLKALSLYITNKNNVAASDAFVQTLKDRTLLVVPWIGIILGVVVLWILVFYEFRGRVPAPGRHGPARLIDPQKQPLLDTIFTMPWTHWFFALLCGWGIFLLLFTVLFTNIRGGIGDGIWQGLYYWLQQQQVARGGQPWYYYLLLIPLYEQIGLVFGFVGIVSCLRRPTRFRLFLVYWFVGNFVIYSWAAEKMPWLMIHITMPMMVLAAIGLEPAVVTALSLIKQWPEQKMLSSAALLPSPVVRPARGRVVGAIFAIVMAFLLLLPTLHNMYEVDYVHAADAPHEMMIYVQTTTDITIMMAKIDAVDQKLYGGKHELAIGILADATWPFAWYVRDYPNVCFNFSTAPCSADFPKHPPVIISGGDNLYSVQSQYTATGPVTQTYAFHQYHMRTQWSQGYMPPPCIRSAANPCTEAQPYIGVGPLLWLSYGDTPPAGVTFNPWLAMKNVWQWWWERKAIGVTDGTYDMALLIRSDIHVAP